MRCRVVDNGTPCKHPAAFLVRTKLMTDATKPMPACASHATDFDDRAALRLAIRLLDKSGKAVA